MRYKKWLYFIPILIVVSIVYTGATWHGVDAKKHMPGCILGGGGDVQNFNGFVLFSDSAPCPNVYSIGFPAYKIYSTGVNAKEINFSTSSLIFNISIIFTLSALVTFGSEYLYHSKQKKKTTHVS